MAHSSAQSCPVSGVKVDETVVRLIAAQVVILVSVATISQSFILSAVIALDFATRAFGFSQFSLLRTIAKGIKSSLKLTGKMTDEAPKKFAASIGFSVISLLAISQFINWTFLGVFLGGLIVTFAALESVLSVCIGCILYNVLHRLKQQA